MSRKKERRLMGEINVVPYIDVMLVLLIIFMITAPLLTQGISVDLPAVGAQPLDPDLLRENEPLVLSVDREGAFYLNIADNPDAPVDEQTVVNMTAAVIRQNAATPVLVKADENVPWGRLARGMVLLTQAGAEVDVVLTRSASEFVGAVTFEALTGRPVHSALVQAGHALDHIKLARAAHVVVIAPATADFVARAATGRGNDLLSACLLATTAPVLFVPAMNDRMWAHGQTQRNVAHLRELGYEVLEPDEGELAAGEVAGFGGGGVHGYRALEGTFLGVCIFSGRAAGRAAAEAVG